MFERQELRLLKEGKPVMLCSTVKNWIVQYYSVESKPKFCVCTVLLVTEQEMSYLFLEIGDSCERPGSSVSPETCMNKRLYMDAQIGHRCNFITLIYW